MLFMDVVLLWPFPSLDGCPMLDRLPPRLLDVVDRPPSKYVRERVDQVLDAVAENSPGLNI